MKDLPDTHRRLSSVPSVTDGTSPISVGELQHRLRASEALIWALIGAFDAVGGPENLPFDVLSRLTAAVHRFPGDLGSWAEQVDLAFDLARPSTSDDLDELARDQSGGIDWTDNDGPTSWTPTQPPRYPQSGTLDNRGEVA